MTKTISAALAVMAILGSSAVASAGTITFNLSTEYSGGAQPSGDLVATFEDVLGGVQLTMDASALTGGEFVSNWVFNFSLDASKLAVTHQSGATASSVGLVNQTFDVNPSKFYDIQFSFPTSNSSSSRLGPNFNTSVYLFTSSTLTLDVTQFNVLSSGGNSNTPHFYSAAHVQGIVPNAQNKTSGKVGDGNSSDNDVPISVPEPSSAAAAIFGLSAIGLAGRFVRK
jgi:hypothetical protein